MFKKMSTILLAVAGIALIGLGTINEAKAETGIYDGGYSCNNFDFNLVSVVRDGDEYKYNYVLRRDNLSLSKISYFSLGIDEYFVLSASVDGIPVGTINVPGIGGLDGWLAGVPQLQTFSTTPQNISEAKPLTISVSGDAGVREGLIAAYTKAGSKIEKCFIFGPVPPPSCPDLPIDVTVPATKHVALNNNTGDIFEYCIDIDQMTGCPYPDAVPYVCGTDPKVYLDYDGDFVLGSSADNGDDTGPTTPTMIMGEGMDPRCPITKAAHNPCQWIILSGRPYGPVCW
jgi:hypothetical protein